MKFKQQRNNRFFFVQYIFCNLFIKTDFNDILYFFSFDEIDLDYIQQMIHIYEKNLDIINDILTHNIPIKYNLNIIKALVITFLIDQINIDINLCISEILKLSDLFYSDTKLIHLFINNILMYIKKSQIQIIK